MPSSAGPHTPGLEKGPAALRGAGLVELLRNAGFGVDDRGDVEGFRWRPDLDRPNGQNAGAVARVATLTAEAVAATLARRRMPLVLGGDCTITIGVVAGLARAGAAPALLYVDGGPDLYTPETRAVGNLDAMGVAHMLAVPGHLPEVADVGPKVPLLAPGHVVAYGHTLPEGDHERRLLDDLGIAHVPAQEVHQDDRAAAGRALGWVEAAAPWFVLHLDVDVLEFAGAPLADVPNSGGEPTGLTLGELAASVSVFAASPSLAAVVVTEVNPDHVPDAEVLRAFAATLVGALTATGKRP